MNDPEYQYIEFDFLDQSYLYIGGTSYVTPLDAATARDVITQVINNHLQSMQRHHVPAVELVARTLDFLGVATESQRIRPLEQFLGEPLPPESIS